VAERGEAVAELAHRGGVARDPIADGAVERRAVAVLDEGPARKSCGLLRG
jgi:hypothetical protein